MSYPFYSCVFTTGGTESTITTESSLFRIFLAIICTTLSITNYDMLNARFTAVKLW